jgi:hypothetical protein
MRSIFVIGCICLLILTGCSGGGNHAAKHSLAVQDWHIEVIPYKGHMITCLIHQVGSGGHGTWGGPSCDWVEYHHEFGWSQNR